MDKFTEYSGKFDSYFNEYFSFLKNDYVSAILIIILIAYAGFVAPKLPKKIAKLFDCSLVKILFFFLIVFFMKYTPTISLIAAVAVIVSIQTMNRYKLMDEAFAIVNAEKKIKSYNATGCKCASVEPEYEEEPIIPVIPPEVKDDDHPIIPSVILDEHESAVEPIVTPINGVLPNHQDAEKIPEIPSAAGSISSASADISKETLKDEVMMNADEIQKKIGRALRPDELAKLCVQAVAKEDPEKSTVQVKKEAKELFTCIVTNGK